MLRTLSGKLTTQAMKDRVMSVLRVWEDWAIYPPLFTKARYLFSLVSLYLMVEHYSLQGLEASFLKDDKLLQDVFSSKLVYHPLCVLSPHLNHLLLSVAAVEPLSIDHPSYNAEVDGTPLADLSTLAKFPFWIRESVRVSDAASLLNKYILKFERCVFII